MNYEYYESANFKLLKQSLQPLWKTTNENFILDWHCTSGQPKLSCFFVKKKLFSQTFTKKNLFLSCKTAIISKQILNIKILQIILVS